MAAVMDAFGGSQAHPGNRMFHRNIQPLLLIGDAGNRADTQLVVGGQAGNSHQGMGIGNRTQITTGRQQTLQQALPGLLPDFILLAVQQAFQCVTAGEQRDSLASQARQGFIGDKSQTFLIRAESLQRLFTHVGFRVLPFLSPGSGFK